MREYRYRYYTDEGLKLLAEGRYAEAQAYEVDFRAPQNDEELAEALAFLFGLRYPRRAVCSGHTAPFDALAEAYFARSPVTVWVASRGFGGKTTLMAGLALMELLSQYDVVILGGSGEQTNRVHKATAEAWSHWHEVRVCQSCGKVNEGDEADCVKCGRSLASSELCVVRAPRHLIRDDPRVSWTITKWGNELRALTASTKAVRGPHPHRLRMDEVDEMDIRLVDAAMGQTMKRDPARPTQIVFSSTHHYEHGTMAEILRRAAERGWPVRRWCYKETLLSEDNPGSWLLLENVEQKRMEVTSKQWRVEYDLEPPSEGGTMFARQTIETLFLPGSEIDDALNRYYEFEAPVDGAVYATGADWGRKSDLSVIATLRVDVQPARLVAWERHLRQPWPLVVDRFNERVRRYPGRACHDATGLGDVVDSYLEVAAEAVQMVGAVRSGLFLGFEKAVESGVFQLPRLRSLRELLSYLQREDLYGAGHPPDEVVALAMAVRAAGLVPGARKTKSMVLRPRHF